MRISPQDIYWLKSTFPSLIYDPTNNTVVGELDFCASYNAETKNLYIEGFNCDYKSLQKTDKVLCDVYEIEIRLDDKTLTSGNWPTVYEVGSRIASISKKLNINSIDLHFNNQDGSCCLGINFATDKTGNIKEFIYHLIMPFFYRLTYVENYGLQAARNDLWGEYSHDNDGLQEYILEMRKLKTKRAKRNAPCPCGSGKKYKNCHLDEVQAIIKYASNY